MSTKKANQIVFWSRNCTGCSRARRFLASYEDLKYESVDVRATPVEEDEALRIAREAKLLWTKNGTRVREINLARDNPDDEELRKIVLGRSKTMRAPALKVGDTLMIGYDEDAYLELLGLD